MQRSTPLRVLTETWIATSSGVPSFWMPPMPQYRPSVFSRTTTKSMSSGPLSASGPVTPG